MILHCSLSDWERLQSKQKKTWISFLNSSNTFTLGWYQLSAHNINTFCSEAVFSAQSAAVQHRFVFFTSHQRPKIINKLVRPLLKPLNLICIPLCFGCCYSLIISQWKVAGTSPQTKKLVPILALLLPMSGFVLMFWFNYWNKVCA